MEVFLKSTRSLSKPKMTKKMELCSEWREDKDGRIICHFRNLYAHFQLNQEND